MGMLGWGIATAIILMIIICLVFMIRHFYDSPAYSMADEVKYRNALCISVRRDFEGAMEQLLELLDALVQKANPRKKFIISASRWKKPSGIFGPIPNIQKIFIFL